MRASNRVPELTRQVGSGQHGYWGNLNEPIHILIIAERSHTIDTLRQLCSRLPLPTQVSQASTLEEIENRFAQGGYSLLLADPFALGGREQSPYWVALQNRSKRAPLIALVPEDTPACRDAALKLGANGVVTLEHAATELPATGLRLLGRSRLVNNFAGQVSQIAFTASPAGNAAYQSQQADYSLKKLSDRAVEELASSLGPIPVEDEYRLPLAQAAKGQSFLRGLTLLDWPESAGRKKQVYRTACAVNCGGHFCGLKVTVRDNRIAKIEPADFPDERFKRICLKGISYVQSAEHAERLLKPLKRIGERGQGQWREISWVQAADEIAEKFGRVMEQHGPQSLMFFTYSGQLSAINGMTGAYLRLASLLGASGTSIQEFGVDSAVPSGIEDSLGKGSGYLANDFTDLPNSRLILIWGADPVQSRMNWWKFFLEAKEAGTKLIAIDPVFSSTASKCQQWLGIRPGTDLYLALAMLNVIVGEDWIDRDYVLRHTVAPLLVRSDDGQFLRDEVGGYLVWDETRGAAAPAQKAKGPALEGEYLVNQVACKTAYSLLKEMLAPYTPEFAAEKTGIPAEQVRALSQAYAQSKPARIFTIYGIDRWHHGATFGRLIATLGALTGNIGISGGGAGVDGFCQGLVFSGDFTFPEGKEYRPVNVTTLPEYIQKGEPYPIKAVMLAFSNWLNQWPDRRELLEKVLPQLDLLVVADQYMTESARWADYVLPTANIFEREDIVKGPYPFIQYQPAILEPPGECLPDFEIARLLAERLGQGEQFSQPMAAYMEEILHSDRDLKGEPLSVETLRKEGLLVRPHSAQPLVAHKDLKFNTPTGRIEFYTERLLPYGSALPRYEAPAEADLDGPASKDFPFVCINKHSPYRVHSAFGNLPWLRDIDKEPEVVIHPAIAVERGIRNGDKVRVFNPRGEVLLRARLSEGMSPQVVLITQGWQSKDFLGGHLQSLTHTVTNPSNALGANCSYSDVLVDIERAANP